MTINNISKHEMLFHDLYNNSVEVIINLVTIPQLSFPKGSLMYAYSLKKYSNQIIGKITIYCGGWEDVDRMSNRSVPFSAPPLPSSPAPLSIYSSCGGYGTHSLPKWKCEMSIVPTRSWYDRQILIYFTNGVDVVTIFIFVYIYM